MLCWCCGSYFTAILSGLPASPLGLDASIAARVVIAFALGFSGAASTTGSPLSPPELGVLVVGAVVGGAVLWMARLLTFAIWLRLGLRGAGA